MTEDEIQMEIMIAETMQEIADELIFEQERKMYAPLGGHPVERDVDDIDEDLWLDPLYD